MPHYDESFIHDDNLNQRRNKRSYAVYKHGMSPLSLIEPSDVFHALEERSTNAIKRNIRNIKARGSRTKNQNIPILTTTKNPDIITDHCPRLSYPKKYYDIRNNNFLLVPCKSLDNLSIKQVGKKNVEVIRSGVSLHNLVAEERLQHYSSTPEDRSYSQGRGDARSYYFNEERQKPQRRYSRGFAAPGVGVYRQISTEADNFNKVAKDSELSSGEPGSGHRGSLRGANKLARRARSFKDDLLERISNMRSPQQQQHPPHLSSAIRSHSPLSPKLRNIGMKPPPVDEGELTPAKEMERLVKDVTCGLKHFSDVITKKKLEMLPGNGTLVFESIANIHKAIKPYCNRSPQLTNAVKRLCSALATLIRLCDDVTADSLRADAGGGEAPDLQPERVVRVVRDTRVAVEEVAKLAEQHMSRPALSPRPALVSPRASTQRNSLPDIPLTPKEMVALGAAGGGGGGGAGAEGGVRASHSSESVLDAPQPPPPKPARITRKIELAPPLPPKRKSANENNCQSNLYVLSSIDRTSFQSRSSGSGSLESMVNASHEEEPRALRDGGGGGGSGGAHEGAFASPGGKDAAAICSCNNTTDGRTSLDSSSIDSVGHEALNNTHTHSNFNHNRNSREESISLSGVEDNVSQLSDNLDFDDNIFSNESGFVSVGHAHELSADHNVTAYSTHSSWSVANSTYIDSTLDSTDCAKSERIREQTNCFERLNMNVTNNSFTTTQQTKCIKLSSVTSSEDVDKPPELPVKTRRAHRADVQQHFPNVEIRQVCTLHGEVRPHTMADHHPPRPPPLPLKKKHIMAYMEMFGKQLEENKAAAMASAHTENSFRHSIHTSNLASVQHTSIGGISMQRQQVQQTIAQSLTLQHIGTTALSGSEDSISMTSSGNSLAPVEPPALPPKMSKTKQVQIHSSVELLPPPSPRSPRPASYNSSADENSLNYSNCRDSQGSSVGPGKFPLEEELDKLVHPASPAPAQVHNNSSNELLPPASPRPSSYTSSTDESTLNYAHSEDSFVGSSAKFPQESQSERIQPTPSPVPSQRSNNSADRPTCDGEVDIILLTDVSGYLTCNDSPEKVCGGHPEALVVLATKATKDFAYQEAFLVTYRTWLTPHGLMERLVRRCRHYQARPHELRSTLSLLTRVVADLTMSELDAPMVSQVRDFIYWLVEGEELAFAKTLRQILVDKLKQQHAQQNTSNHRYEYESPCAGAVSLHRDTLLDFKATDIAEQMTLLDSELFTRITTAEVLMWRLNHSEELSPNLTRFTAHFNNMSFWARTRILEQGEARDRERYAAKFLQVMKQLKKLRNFNSYLALVSALDSPPLHRLGWPRCIDEPLQKCADLISMDGSFRKYRQALAETQPPCIPYIGIVLQDLTFVHAGNPHLLPDGKINFSKRWQQYHLMENMKRFQKEQYKFRRNERIQAMFNDFDDVLSEEALWQISTNIKPTGGDR